MICLVSTYNGLLAVDPDTGAYWTMHARPLWYYYGIAYNASHLFVAVRGHPDSAVHDNAHVLVYDYDLEHVGTIRPEWPLAQLHQAAWFDGRLWLMCSGADRVAIWDGKDWESWSPAGGSLKDRYHLNSIWADDRRIFLVAHMHGPSQVWEFSNDLKPVDKFPFGHKAHNLWPERGTWATCDSARGQVIAYPSRVLADTGWFPRGASMTPLRRMIGLSSYAPRAERAGKESRLVVYDDRWIPLHSWTLPESGEVTEIRTPGYHDRAYSGFGRVGKRLRIDRAPDGYLEGHTWNRRNC